MGFRPGTNDVVIEPRDPDEPQNEAEYERQREANCMGASTSRPASITSSTG